VCVEMEEKARGRMVVALAGEHGGEHGGERRTRAKQAKFSGRAEVEGWALHCQAWCQGQPTPAFPAALARWPVGVGKGMQWDRASPTSN